jgi:hypothetical protein
MDSRSHEEAKWDLELLPLELEDLKSLEYDFDLTGFDERALGTLLGEGRHPAEDLVPDVPDTPVTQSGDLWLLGPQGPVRRTTPGKLFQVSTNREAGQSAESFAKSFSLAKAWSAPAGSSAWAVMLLSASMV